MLSSVLLKFYQFLARREGKISFALCVLAYLLYRLRQKQKKIKFVQKVAESKFNIVIVGAGFSGLCMGIKLKEAGIPFTILEKGSNLGGTWWFNSYPGCACDIPSHLYSYSFEMKHDWSRMYPLQSEVAEYLKQCAKKYGILPHIRFNTKLIDSEWDKVNKYWKLTTSTGDELHANIFIPAVGSLHLPSIPDFKGKEDFTGPKFHTAEWDHSFDYKEKKIAVVGSAASAIQAVPELAKTAAHVTVFQRTPNWIGPKIDPTGIVLFFILSAIFGKTPQIPYPKSDFFYPKFVQTFYKWFPFFQRLARWRLYWAQEAMFFFVFSRPNGSVAARTELEKFIRTSVAPKLHSKVVPTYPPGCKRVLLHNEFYDSLNYPNVTLVTDGIERFTQKGIVAGGELYDADAIVYATGFNLLGTYTFLKTKDGRRAIVEGDTPQAYLGMTLTDLPNIFVLLGPNTGLGHNSVIWMIECQVNYVVECIKMMIERQFRVLEVKEDVLRAYNEKLQSKFDQRVWNRKNCRSWYQSADGSVFALWTGYTWQYWNLTRKVKIADYNLS